MIDQENIERRAQMIAIEFAIAELFSMICEVHPRPDDLLTRVRGWPQTAADAAGWPGADPAMSDLVSGEIEHALRELSGVITSHVQLFPRRDQ